LEEQIDWRRARRMRIITSLMGKVTVKKSPEEKNFFILRKKLMKTLFFSAIVNAS
jgi:hypothetical protein